MMSYSIEARDQISVKDYGFLPFAKNVGKNFGENVSKNLRGKYKQKILDHTKKTSTDAIKTASKK